MLPAQKGNSTQKVWSTRPSNESLTFVNTDTDDKKNTVAYVGMHNDNIVFDVTNETITNGNTVMALKNGNTTLWSWHLWFNQPDNRADDPATHNHYPTSNALVMNRALGATIDEGINVTWPIKIIVGFWKDGFYYQWGRKDPLQPQTPSNGGTYDATMQNPSTLYSDWKPKDNAWSSKQNEKTVDDPCPPGYKVPSNRIWRDGANTSNTLENLLEYIDIDGYAYNIVSGTDMTVNIMYPFYGYIDSTTGEIVQDKDLSVRITGTPVEGETNAITSPRYAYKSNDFSLLYNERPGFLWTSNSEVAIKYNDKRSKENIIIHTGETRSRTKKNFLQWNDWSEWTSFSGSVGGGTVTQNFYNADPVRDLYTNNSHNAAANALPVRCVSMESPVQ